MTPSKAAGESHSVNTQDYRVAPGGDGPHAATWNDKPHRLIYDLCSEIERLRLTANYTGEVEQLVEALFRIRELTKGENRLQSLTQIAHQALRHQNERTDECPDQ